MQFGIFDHLDRNKSPLKDYYEARLQLIEMYDREGFYAYHVAEHHSTPLGMAPSPSVFLSAVAQRTKRLRFGPLVYALPLYHPIRLIEEICMLDQMSGGRLDIGFGPRRIADRSGDLRQRSRQGGSHVRRGPGADHARFDA
jgi:Coenzyme F420-dependent N5,N10-methylene tetrahydromethanopterin reductase and related flavin-dependent oxidoreductases